ncbi:hypothetical protein ACFL27_23135, partial [candidate division CSSED10-310 bacterium]
MISKGGHSEVINDQICILRLAQHGLKKMDAIIATEVISDTIVDLYSCSILAGIELEVALQDYSGSKQCETTACAQNIASFLRLKLIIFGVVQKTDQGLSFTLTRMDQDNPEQAVTVSNSTVNNMD